MRPTIWASTQIFGRCRHVHRSRTLHLAGSSRSNLSDQRPEGRSACHGERSDGNRCRTIPRTSQGMASDTTTRRPSRTVDHQRICIDTMDAIPRVAASRRVNAPISRRWLHQRGRVRRSRYGCVPSRRRYQHSIEGMCQPSLANNGRVDRAAVSKVFIIKPPDPRLRVQRFVLHYSSSNASSGSNPRINDAKSFATNVILKSNS